MRGSLLLLPLCLLGCQGRALLLSDGASSAPGDAGAITTSREDAAIRCGDNAICGPGAYCHQDGCTSVGLLWGVCRPRPKDCWKETLTLACGCDGKTYVNPCEAHAAGVNIDHPGRCAPDPCQDVTCSVINDCCHCMALDSTSPPPPLCPDSPCPGPLRCEARRIPGPAAYCLGGHCLLESTNLSCAKDSDCVKSSDCCTCLALPRTAKPPLCPADCEAGMCTGLGLDEAVPRCVGGHCRLALP